jgi:hypothetical protein
VIEVLLQAESALSLRLLDRAESLYRQVSTSDPRNAIAVVGLARVALERGQEVQALVLARRALAIDPENVSAQRLTQRLEEILAYRGEPPPAPERDTPVERPATPAQPTPPASPPAVGPPARSWRDRLLRRGGGR